MLNQAREFNETVAVTGLILTKLDGSARGGSVVRVLFYGIQNERVGVLHFCCRNFTVRPT